MVVPRGNMSTMKAATMEQLRKPRPSAIRHLEMAFDEYGNQLGDLVRMERKEHLDSYVSAEFSCKHRWVPVTDEKGLEFLRKKYEENEVRNAHFCVNCGATCLRDDGRLVAYDATFKFSDKPRPPKKPGHKENRK